MTAPKIDRLLQIARNEFHDKNIVSFLGDVKSGKTVVSALLKHSLFNHFIPKKSAQYQAVVSSGNTVMNNILGNMIEKGQFPPSTRPIDNPEVIIEIHKKIGRGSGKIELMLRDTSGENYSDYLVEEYSNHDERIEDILTINAIDKKIGPLSYLIFSKIYVILIDCSKDDLWVHEQSYAAQMINSLYHIHRIAKLTHNDKITNPIAILFTKSDKLSDTDKKKRAGDLMQKMPEFVTSLDYRHSGPIGYFKVHVDVEDESEVDVKERVEREKSIALHNHNIKEKERLAKIQNRINEEVEKAEEYARQQPDWTEQQISEHVEKIRNEISESLNSQIPPQEFVFDESKYNTATTKIKKPLHYTDGEYIKFISWILRNVSS